MKKWIMMVVALVFLASFCLGCAGHILPQAGQPAGLASAPEVAQGSPKIQGMKGTDYTGRPIFRSMNGEPTKWPQQGL
jgi:tetrahydromethanopterin S-methyltransferase subunit D